MVLTPFKLKVKNHIENNHCCLHSSGFRVLLVSLDLRPLTKETVNTKVTGKNCKDKEKLKVFGHLMDGAGSVVGLAVFAKGAEGATGFLGLGRNWSEIREKSDCETCL